MKAVALFLDQPCGYGDALELQQSLHRLRLADEIPDTILFLEHTPVVTLGRRGRTDFLLVSPDALAEQGIDFFVASRGGDVTYHGPGQLVMYPILKFGTRAADAHGYLNNLEKIAVETAKAFGVDAYRREGMSGAWIDAGKIAAIGFQIKRWVTMHGMSFNVNCDSTGFSTIIGCGLEGESVASISQAMSSAKVCLQEVRGVMCQVFERVLQRSVVVKRFDGSSGQEELEGILSWVLCNAN